MTACGIRYSVFGIRYSVFGIRYSVFGIRYSVFGIRYSVFGIRYSVNGTESKKPAPHIYSRKAGHRSNYCSAGRISPCRKICLVVLRFLWLRRIVLGSVSVRRSRTWHAKQALHHHLWAGLAVANKRGNTLAHMVLVELILKHANAFT